MKAYELLSSPEKWTQNVSSRDITGRHVTIHHENAVCFCMWGAIRKCYDTDDNNRINSTIITDLVRQELKLTSLLEIFGWNDRHSFEEVQNLLIKLDI